MQLDDMPQVNLPVSELTWFKRGCIDHHAEQKPMTEVTHIMGHADQGRTYALYYKPQLSMVDVQGILMQGEEEDIDWNQYLQPEETERCSTDLPLSKLREIEAQVAAVQGVQERSRL